MKEIQYIYYIYLLSKTSQYIFFYYLFKLKKGKSTLLMKKTIISFIIYIYFKKKVWIFISVFYLFIFEILIC